MGSASEKAATVGAVRNYVKHMEAASQESKDFETERSGVFAAPGLPSLVFSTAEIRDHENANHMYRGNCHGDLMTN